MAEPELRERQEIPPETPGWPGSCTVRENGPLVPAAPIPVPFRGLPCPARGRISPDEAAQKFLNGWQLTRQKSILGNWTDRPRL